LYVRRALFYRAARVRASRRPSMSVLGRPPSWNALAEPADQE
jgi:hypothetical protein